MGEARLTDHFNLVWNGDYRGYASIGNQPIILQSYDEITLLGEVWVSRPKYNGGKWATSETVTSHLLE
jgi:hypothetical protein